MKNGKGIGYTWEQSLTDDDNDNKQDHILKEIKKKTKKRIQRTEERRRIVGHTWELSIITDNDDDEQDHQKNEENKGFKEMNKSKMKTIARNKEEAECNNRAMETKIESMQDEHFYYSEGNSESSSL